MIKKYWEEVLLFVIFFGALIIAFSPLFNEMVRVGTRLPVDRYPLMETEFPPDMRVYLSQMREGYDGKWLVSEKYTSESHQPTMLHLNYLLMGKITGWLGIDPVQAFPLWRLLGGAAMLASGYFFIQRFVREKKTRVATFLFFAVIGNLPMLVANGIPLLGKQFSLVISWYTFLDPVKRLVFYPHYTLASAFVILAIAFLGKDGTRDSMKAGLFALLTSIILPQGLIIIVTTAICFNLLNLRNGVSRIVKAQLPFWGLTLISLGIILFSLSYFPWNLQLKNDASLSIPFSWREYLSALGPTGWLGIVASMYLLILRKKEGFLVACWIFSTIAIMYLSGIFRLSNQFRWTQIDFHLPLAVTSALLLSAVTSRVRLRRIAFGVTVILVILPSVIVWPVSLKSQSLFTEAKIQASYPLIPAHPYVVYPVKSFMEGIDWLKNKTSHDEIVLAGETAGSMIPAYSGNTVYLGHGHQTVNFPLKQANMQSFYSGKFEENEMKEFLKANRISYVFLGLEESQLAGSNDLSYSFFNLVFRNDQLKIYKVNEKN